MAVPARRLPGIRFEAQPPPLDEVLPRMDIAVFAGFAASGPVHVPVAVDSAETFEQIFGADAPLAWDAARGETLRAQLAPAVRAFFRGGGTRCWVVRVAGEPSYNFFPLAGIVRLFRDPAEASPPHEPRLAPAFARSRAAGRWSDATRVATATVPAPLDIEGFAPEGDRAAVDLCTNAEDDLVAGDLLRIELGKRYIVFVAVDRRTRVEMSPPSARVHLQVEGPATWFSTEIPAIDPDAKGQVVVYTARREPAGLDESFAATPVTTTNTVSRWETSAGTGLFELELQMALEDAPVPGMLVSARVGADEMWMTVQQVGVGGTGASAHDHLRISGRGLWSLSMPPAAAIPAVRRGERLSLELWVTEESGESHRIGDLGLTPAHPRFWADLRTDDERYAPDERIATERRLLWDAPPFPVAGADRTAVLLPIHPSIVPDRWLAAMRQPRTPLERDGLAPRTPLERDDLAAFVYNLFVDPDLAASSTTSIADTAAHLSYTRPRSKGLAGIHAALMLEEATILAAPDAAQPGWVQTVAETPPPPDPSPAVPPPAWGTFLDCRLEGIDPPEWAVQFQPPGVVSGTFTLEWRRAEGATVVLEEAHAATWADSAVLYEGPASSIDIYGRPRGTYYYRVRAVARGRSSDWSPGLTVVVGGLERWIARDERSFNGDTLLAVHRAMLRTAAGRGDLFAILSLPAHYREGDAAEHIRALKDSRAAPIAVGAGERTAYSLPLGAGEAGAYSYGALYHPWAIVREHPGDEVLTVMPPDGLAAGLLARRTLARGAWIAPGNEPFPGVVAVSPAIAPDSRADLLDAGLNLVVQEPRGFVPLAASTLSDDPDFMLINVRRLLSLLRRLALREGATYVFEPHSDAFRRSVQRGFEGMLARMFARGAFAGATAATAFQVTTSASVNTPQSVDLGRFIVELRVAPSLPMTFLTVRLVQTGDRTMVVEER